jgi:hypothetical protein
MILDVTLGGLNSYPYEIVKELFACNKPWVGEGDGRHRC